MRRTKYTPEMLREMQTNAQAQASTFLGLRTLSTVLGSRDSLAGLLGRSFNDNRDYYKSFGWKRELSLYDYLAMYERNPVAGRIVDAAPDGCWREAATIGKDGDALNKAWKDLDKRVHILQKLHILDCLTGVGQYGILYLNYNDGVDPVEPVRGGKTLALTNAVPLSQLHAMPQQWVEDTKDERYGLPQTYNLTLPGAMTGSDKSVLVHASRCIHVIERPLESEVYGRPRLQRLYNFLYMLDQTIGASGEMYWQGAFRGSAFIADPEADMGATDKAAMTEQIEDYIHKLRRYMRLQGVQIHDFPSQVADPAGVVDVILTLISIDTRIPKRILQGAERGELASSQDEVNWIARLDERREQFCEPVILRPVIDQLMQNRVLPAQADYEVTWPELAEPTDADKAALGLQYSQMLTSYVQSGLRAVMTFETYLTKVMNFSEQDAEELAQEADQQEKVRAKQEEKDRATQAKLQAKFGQPGARGIPPVKPFAPKGATGTFGKVPMTLSKKRKA